MQRRKTKSFRQFYPASTPSIAQYVPDKKAWAVEDDSYYQQKNVPEYEILSCVIKQTLIDASVPIRDKSKLRGYPYRLCLIEEQNVQEALDWVLDRQEGDEYVPWTLEWVCVYLNLYWKDVQDLVCKLVNERVREETLPYRASTKRRIRKNNRKSL